MSMTRHPSGAVRDDSTTPLWSDIPLEFLRELAKVYKEGELHYGRHNWRSGLPDSNIIDHMLDHLASFISGDRTEPYMAKVAWAAIALWWNDAHNLPTHDVMASASNVNTSEE